MNEKQKKAAQIVDEIHGLLHSEERRNQGEVTYLGIARITGRIGEHFSDGLPPQVQSAINEALTICSVQGTTKSNNDKLFAGLALAAVGVILGVSGIIQALQGVVEQPYRAWYSRVWDAVFGKPPLPPIIHYGGPFCIAFGILLICCGVYLLNRRTSPKQHALRAAEVLRIGIASWSKDTDSAYVTPPPRPELETKSKAIDS